MPGRVRGALLARRGWDRRKECREAKRAAVTLGVDEEGRGRRDAASDRRSPASADSFQMDVLAHFPAEPRQVQAEVGRIPRQVKLVRSAPVFEEPIVHLPELSLGRGALRRLGGVFGPLVLGGLRKTPENIPYPGPQLLLYLLDGQVSIGAGRAAEVTVADEGHGRQGRSPDVVRPREAGRPPQAVTPFLHVFDLSKL